mgnify:CR=1 FL=1
MADASSITRYRRSPRPSYFNASTATESPISIEFETFLLTLSNQDKQTLITRLQKCVSGAKTNGPRDNLMRVALDFQAMNAGAVAQELNVTLQELSDTTTSLVADAGDDVLEVSLLMADIGKAYGESVFRNRVAQNSVTAASFLQAQIGNGIGSGVSANQKKQISSWIKVIASYIRPGG